LEYQTITTETIVAKDKYMQKTCSDPRSLLLYCVGYA